MSLDMESIKALACPFINHRSLNSANTANREVVANICPARQTAAFGGYCIPEPCLAPSFRAVTLVSDRTGEFVAVNVLTVGKVRVLTAWVLLGLAWPNDYSEKRIAVHRNCLLPNVGYYDASGASLGREATSFSGIVFIIKPVPITTITSNTVRITAIHCNAVHDES